jgi:lipopolysaccharide transport system ATP-binding protein
MSIILKAENISKQYCCVTVGTGTLSHDLNRRWASLRRKEEPYLKVVGDVNDCSTRRLKIMYRRTVGVEKK